MSLQDPTKKMSKSDPNPSSFIAITDEPNVILKKFKRAVTDSEARIAYNENQPGIANLLSIYSIFTGKTIEEALEIFDGMGYGQLKVATAEAVIEELTPIREEYNRILADRVYLEGVLNEGARQAAAVAEKTLHNVYAKTGLGSFFA